jgi:hypothetical protein
LNHFWIGILLDDKFACPELPILQISQQVHFGESSHGNQFADLEIE